VFDLTTKVRESNNIKVKLKKHNSLSLDIYFCLSFQGKKGIGSDG
jgi:hypothetical protein